MTIVTEISSNKKVKLEAHPCGEHTNGFIVKHFRLDESTGEYYLHLQSFYESNSANQAFDMYFMDCQLQSLVTRRSV